MGNLHCLLELNQLDDGSDGNKINEGNDGNNLDDGSDDNNIDDGSDDNEINEGNDGSKINEGNDANKINEGNDGNKINEGNDGNKINEGNDGNKINEGNDGNKINEKSDNKTNEGSDGNKIDDGSDGNKIIEGNDGNKINEGSDRNKINEGNDGNKINEGSDGNKTNKINGGSDVNNIDDGNDGNEINDVTNGKKIDDGSDGNKINDGSDDTKIYVSCNVDDNKRTEVEMDNKTNNVHDDKTAYHNADDADNSRKNKYDGDDDEDDDDGDRGVGDDDDITKDVQEEDGSKAFEYDVFISYSYSDRPWVKDFLLLTLEQEGKTVCLDYRDFPAGRAITNNIVYAIENSHVTILVLTPPFVESEWCRFESKRALMSSLANSKARVLPLILKKCEMPNILKHLTYLDHTSEDVQPYFNKQLIDSLDKAKTWSPQIDQLDILPMSEVQDVVTRTYDQKENRKYTFDKLAAAQRSFIKLSNTIKDYAIVRVLQTAILLFICRFVIYEVESKKINSSNVSFAHNNFGYCILLPILCVLCFLLWACPKWYDFKCVPRLRKWFFNKESVRENLGEMAVKMLDASNDLDNLFKDVEKETKRFTFDYEKTLLERLILPN